MKLTISMIIAVAVAVSGASAFAKGKEQKMPQEQVVTMEVTSEGFVPAQVKVKANQPVKLVVTRKTDRTCARKSSSRTSASRRRCRSTSRSTSRSRRPRQGSSATPAGWT